MKSTNPIKRILSALLVFVMVLALLPAHAHAAEADAALTASLEKAKTYIDGITINNSSNDPATVVKNFKTHFTWDNEKRENSKSYLFDWSYYNGVVFEGIEYLYEVTGESVYKDYVIEYMSNLIAANGTWAKCTNSGYTSKQAAGYDATHGADCYKTASLLLDAYEMTGDSRYLTIAATLYADLDSAASKYSLKNAGNNFRHTWSSDPSPDLWLDGLYMILPFRAEYAKYIGDTEELNLIVSRLQWVSDNMYNSSKGLFYHAADSASSNSGTFWLRSIGWYAAAIVDVMDSMEGKNLETMKTQLKKLVDGMKACQNASNGMWLNNMNASKSSSNPYETSGTALVCYAVMKAVNNGWLDESYADMAILAFNGICNEKLSGTTLKDICFKGVPSGSNSTFYDNEGKGVGPFIMFYAEMLEYVNAKNAEPEVPETTEPTEPAPTEPAPTEPAPTEPAPTEPAPTEPAPTEPAPTEPAPTEPAPTEPTPSEPEDPAYSGSGNLEGFEEALGNAASSITSGTSYYLVNTKANKTLTNTANGSRLAMSGTQNLENVNRWYITHVSGNTYYVQYGGPDGKYLTVGNDSAALTSARTALTLTYNSSYSCWDIGSGNYHLNDYRGEHNYASGYTAGASSDNGSRWALYPIVAAAPQYVLDTDGIDSGEKYIIVYSGKALQNNNGVDNNPTVTIRNNTITPTDDSALAWTITLSGGNYYVENNGSYLSLSASGNDPIGSRATVSITLSGSKYIFRNTSGSGAYLRYSSSQLFCAGTSSSNSGMSLYRRTGSGTGDAVVFSLAPAANQIKPGNTLALNGTVTVGGKFVDLSNCTIVWSSSNNGCATVSGGAVTGVSNGNVTITATLSAVNGTSLKENIVLTVPVTVQGHDYTATVTAPTCEAAGYTTYTCTICGDSYVADEVAALGHSYKAVTVEATCEKDGAITYTCDCGDTYTEVISATGHNYKSVVTAPTCENAGYTTYTCGNCGDSYVADEVAALGHSYKAVTVEATCTENGSVTYTCDCGDTYTEVIPALGHDYKTVVAAPTCTENGYTTYTCACGDKYVADEVAALGHKYETVVTAPTCTEGGYTTHTCAVCGNVTVDTYVAALGHDYASVTTEATCTEEGSVVRTCITCGDSNTQTIPAIGHNYKTVTVEATCETDGSVTTTCAICGDSTVEVVPALGHNYEAVVTAPTCTEGGYTTYTCACGDKYVADEVAALGHKYEAVVTAPTCTEVGYTVYTCACGDKYVADEVAALGHKYETVVTAPTCTKAGYTTYTCACGHSYTADRVAALGHKYETVVTAPTCTEVGYTIYACACGDKYVADEVAALGHKYETVVTAPTCTKAGYTTYTCACGDTYTADEVAALGHSYSTKEVDGYLVYTCVCGDTYSESIGWIKLPGSYVLDTDGIEIGAEHKYIIVGANKDYALTLSGSTIGAAKVTVNGNTITLDNASGYEFYFVNNSSKESGSYLLTQNGTKSVYHMGGNMYYGTDNKGYWHIGTSSNGSYQLYDNDYSKWYLNYGYVWGSESVSRFAVSSSARYVRLFKAVDSYVRLTGETSQIVAHGAAATESAVLKKILIQTSTNGSNVSGTAAVTASMITWDKAFDGYTAGTYTATVTYNGQSVGTITVTVTGEHTYETVVVTPTCTEGGYSVHTCTVCGLSYQSDVTEALGHSYTAKEVGGYLVYTCEHCGDSYSEKIEPEFTYTRVSTISSGNNYVITLYSGNKYYALSHANNQISAVQITVSNGEITSEITEDLLWTYSGSKLSYKDGNTTYYLYASTSGGWFGWGGTTTLTVSKSSSSTVSFSNSKLKVGSYYLRYSNGSISVNSSSTTTYLFVETEE